MGWAVTATVAAAAALGVVQYTRARARQTAEQARLRKAAERARRAHPAKGDDR